MSEVSFLGNKLLPIASRPDFDFPASREIGLDASRPEVLGRFASAFNIELHATLCKLRGNLQVKLYDLS